MTFEFAFLSGDLSAELIQKLGKKKRKRCPNNTTQDLFSFNQSLLKPFYDQVKIRFANGI